nr:hypothetical protein Iba_chr10cCG10770 [Ipomoea batatas]
MLGADRAGVCRILSASYHHGHALYKILCIRPGFSVTQAKTPGQDWFKIRIQFTSKVPLDVLCGNLKTNVLSEEDICLQFMVLLSAHCHLPGSVQPCRAKQGANVFTWSSAKITEIARSEQLEPVEADFWEQSSFDPPIIVSHYELGPHPIDQDALGNLGLGKGANSGLVTRGMYEPTQSGSSFCARAGRMDEPMIVKLLSGCDSQGDSNLDKDGPCCVCTVRSGALGLPMDKCYPRAGVRDGVDDPLETEIIRTNCVGDDPDLNIGITRDGTGGTQERELQQALAVYPVLPWILWPQPVARTWGSTASGVARGSRGVVGSPGRFEDWQISLREVSA